MRIPRTRKLLLVLLALTGGGLVTLTLLTDLEVDSDILQPIWLFGLHNSSRAGDIACFFYRSGDDDDNKERPDNYVDGDNLILNDLKEMRQSDVVRETSIFFHETSCHNGNAPLLTARQACAVESAAKMNPHSQVYVLFPSPVLLKNYTSNSFLKHLETYNNFHILHINMERYFQDTPLDSWYKSGYLLTSQWPRSHASDLLRYLTLWKFGGIYLDLDVVVVKSLKGLTNFAGAESDSAVAAGVLSFSHNGSGHELASNCLHELKDNFRGYDWGYNGPGVITRVLKRVCKVHDVNNMSPEKCKGFQVYPPSWFYPIPWRQWHLYFDTSGNQTVVKKLEDSHVIHVWNKFSTNTSVNVGSNQPYGLIAQKYCPKVYSGAGHVF